MARAGADQLLCFSYSPFAFFHGDLSFPSPPCSAAPLLAHTVTGSLRLEKVSKNHWVQSLAQHCHVQTGPSPQVPHPQFFSPRWDGFTFRHGVCAGLCWAGHELVLWREEAVPQGMSFPASHFSEITGNHGTFDRWPWKSSAIEGYFSFGMSCNETLISLPLNLHDRSSK